MKIDELKSMVSIYRALLKGKDGTLCRFSEEGPVGISVIDDLVVALESQQKRYRGSGKEDPGSEQISGSSPK